VMDDEERDDTAYRERDETSDEAGMMLGTLSGMDPG